MGMIDRRIDRWMDSNKYAHTFCYFFYQNPDFKLF